MLIYKGTKYANRRELVKEIGPNKYRRLLKNKDKNLVLIINDTIDSDGGSQEGI